MARRVNVMVLMVVLVVALLHYSAAQTRHQVGDALGWTIPPSTTAYSVWASTQTFTVGDVLVFNYTTGIHNVVEVTKAELDACSANNPISISTTGPTTITLSSVGHHHFICSVGQHCTFGQKLSVNVSATSLAPQPAAMSPPSPTPTPSPVSMSGPSPSPVLAQAPSPSPVLALAPSPFSVPTSAPSPSSVSAPTPFSGPETYIVGDAMGWVVPPTGVVAYQTWALNKTFMVGDALVFNFFNGAHNVARVTKEIYESCNTTTVTNSISSSPARITLTTSGEHFFICAVPTHCSLGQQLAINVTDINTDATPFGSPAQPPSSRTPSSPTPAGNGVPANSAPTFFVTSLPIIFLAAAMALLY